MMEELSFLSNKMAEKYPGRAIFCAVILLYFSNIFHFSLLQSASASRTRPRIQHCWSGSEDDLSDLRNLSCSTGMTALGNIVSLTDKSTLGDAGNREDNSTVPVRNYYCMAFRYYTTETSPTDGSTTSTQAAEYTCDMDDACSGRTMLIGFKYTYKGRTGDLFCCDHGDNCNTHALISSPLEHRTCYNAVRDNKTTSIEIKPCPKRDTPCMQKVVKQTEERDGALVVIREEHHCDNYHTCASHNLTGLLGHACRNILDKTTDTEIELCCCETNNCLPPPWLNDPASHPTSDHPNDSTWQKTVVISLLVAVSFLAVTVSFCFVLRIVKQRKQSKDKKSAHFTRHTYASVTGDGTDNTADNVQIIQS